MSRVDFPAFGNPTISQEIEAIERNYTAIRLEGLLIKIKL